LYKALQSLISLNSNEQQKPLLDDQTYNYTQNILLERFEKYHLKCQKKLKKT